MFAVILFIVLLVLAFVLYCKFRKTDVLRLGKPRISGVEDTGVADAEGAPIEEEGILVNIDDFLEEYIVGDSIPEGVLMELQLKRLAGETQAKVSRKVLELVQHRCANYWKGEIAREVCLKREEQAKTYEDEGRLEDAIALYKKNVDSGFPAYRSFDRLISIYDDRDDLLSKIEILKKSVVAFGDQHPILREICELKLEQAQRMLSNSDNKSDAD